MTITIVVPNRPAIAREIEDFEGRLGSTLPNDYRTFLLTINGGTPEPCFYEAPPPINQVGVHLFFGIFDAKDNRDVRYVREQMMNRVPQGILPIADLPGGDLLCLSVRTDSFGHVFYWDHEMEAEEGQPATFSNLPRIGTSFRGFFEGLNRSEPVVLKPGQVKGVWVRPDSLES